jgi:hypothetical protein
MVHHRQQSYFEVAGYAAAGVMLVSLLGLALTATVLDLFF